MQQCNISAPPHCSIETRSRLRFDHPSPSLVRDNPLFRSNTPQRFLVGFTVGKRRTHDQPGHLELSVARATAHQLWRESYSLWRGRWGGGVKPSRQWRRGRRRVPQRSRQREGKRRRRRVRDVSPQVRNAPDPCTGVFLRPATSWMF